MPSKKKTSFVDDAVDAVAKKLKIGGLEKSDGSYVASSDLSPSERAEVERLAKQRNWSRTMETVSKAETGMGTGLQPPEVRKNWLRVNSDAKKVREEAQGKINKIYSDSGKMKK